MWVAAGTLPRGYVWADHMSPVPVLVILDAGTGSGMQCMGPAGGSPCLQTGSPGVTEAARSDDGITGPVCCPFAPSSGL